MTSPKADPWKMFFLRICSFHSLLFQADEVRSQHNRKKQLRCQRHCRSWGNPTQEGVLWVSDRRGWMRRIYWLGVFTCVSGLNVLAVTPGISTESHGNSLCFTSPSASSSHRWWFHWCLEGPFCLMVSHPRSLPRKQSNHWLVFVLPYFSESIEWKNGVLCLAFSKTFSSQPWQGCLCSL